MSKVDPLSPALHTHHPAHIRSTSTIPARKPIWTMIDEYYAMLGRPVLAHQSIVCLDDVKSVVCAPERAIEEPAYMEWDASAMPGYSIPSLERKRTSKGMRRIFGRKWERTP